MKNDLEHLHEQVFDMHRLRKRTREINKT